MADNTTERHLGTIEVSRQIARSLLDAPPDLARIKEPVGPDRMTRLIDLAAEVHGCNRVEIIVSLGVSVARIERCSRETPTAIVLESTLPLVVHNSAREGRDGVAVLADALKTRASQQLYSHKRAVEDARAALVAAEAKAKKTTALVEQLTDLAAPTGGPHV